MVACVVKPVLCVVEGEGHVPGVARVVVEVFETAVVAVGVGFGQRLAPGVVDRVGDLVAVLVDSEKGRAENARAVEDLAYADGYVALEIFSRLASVRSFCVVELCAYASSACVVDIPCGIAPVLGYEDIAVCYGKVVDNVTPCDGLLIVLHRCADLTFPYALPRRPAVLEEAEIIRSVAAVLEACVLIARVFVSADLDIGDPYAESIVKVLAAFAVCLLAPYKLVLRAVCVIRYPVRRCLLRSEQHREPSPVLLFLPEMYPRHITYF